MAKALLVSAAVTQNRLEWFEALNPCRGGSVKKVVFGSWVTSMMPVLVRRKNVNVAHSPTCRVAWSEPGGAPPGGLISSFATLENRPACDVASVTDRPSRAIPATSERPVISLIARVVARDAARKR